MLKAVPLFFLEWPIPVVPEGTMVLVQRVKVTWIVPLGATSLVTL
jgi:hypothetical protein